MRRSWLVALVLVIGCSAQPAAHPTSSPVSRATPAPGSLSSGGIVEYTLPAPPVRAPICPPACQPSIGSLALGPDGNVWFTDNNRRVVGWISPAGVIKQFSVGFDLVGGANTIAAGPDGNLYVTASGGGNGKPDWILRVTPAGAITKVSAGQNPGGGFGTGPESITAGPDGNMWFTEFWTNRIGRLTPSGTLTEFQIPTADSGPRGIVTGPDGNLWFVESSRSRPAIAQITTAGDVTEFPITEGPSDIEPNAIVAGPDGDLWFTELSAIGHMTTTGEVAQVALPQGSQPRNLVVAPDRNLWYTDAAKGAIVRLGVTGATRAFPLPRRMSWPNGLTIGADGRIWFGEPLDGRIASIGVRVPVVLMSSRPLVFADASPKTVDIRNIGDAPLTITKVRTTGVDAALFAVGGDTCAGASLAPDATCHIQLSHGSGGPATLQTALLEITDNATGSPQRLSLLAQVPQCSLPVTAPGDQNTPNQGEMFDVRSAQILYDPNGGFENIGAASGVRTSAGLTGVSSGYYDRPYGRWLPVYDASQVSPDGSHYVYMPLGGGVPLRSEVHIVDVASGAEKVWHIPEGMWWPVAYAQKGIYFHQAFEGIGPGLSFLELTTGAFRTVFTSGRVTLVDGNVAWLGDRNNADTLPGPAGIGPADNEVLRRDLTTGKTVLWLYRPGKSVVVVAAFGGKPILAIADGTATTYWISDAPDQVTKIEFPFDSEIAPSVSGFIPDLTGLWVGSAEGVYLWTPRTGAALMTEQPGTPAGTCA